MLCLFPFASLVIYSSCGMCVCSLPCASCSLQEEEKAKCELMQKLAEEVCIRPYMLHHNTAQHSTMHHSTPHHSTAHHSTAQHSTAHHNTPQYSTAQHSTAQHSTAHHSTPHHSTAQHNTAHHTSLTCCWCVLCRWCPYRLSCWI